MSIFFTTFFFLAMLLLCSQWLAADAGGFRSWDYGTRFYGEGTYYGYTEGGNCAMGRKSALPKMYQRMLAVAINENQYDYSRSCGACIRLRGSGRGLGGSPIRGPFLAYVHDRCPECQRGDLDLSSSGDGRWQINWKFVPCPYNDASFVFEGSNTFYKKIQVRGLRFPARGMWIAGKKGSRSQDNFFIAGGWFPRRGTIYVIDVKGNHFRARVNLNIASGVIQAPARFNGPIKFRAPRQRVKPSPSPKAPQCIGDWLPCSTNLNPSGKRCCGWKSGYTCKYTMWSRVKHCLK